MLCDEARRPKVGTGNREGCRLSVGRDVMPVSCRVVAWRVVLEAAQMDKVEAWRRDDVAPELAGQKKAWTPPYRIGTPLTMTQQGLTLRLRCNGGSGPEI
jgi:hypothetical protein